MATVTALLRRPEIRLLTLVGPGGVGKTRLALRVATDLTNDFPDGTAFVPLAPVSDPSFVLPTIAHAVGVRESGGRSLLEHLAHALRGARLLLVLDNVEQVIAAGPQLATLLTMGSPTKMLVTSRAPLRVGGEQEFAVPPLRLPDADSPTGPDPDAATPAHLVASPAVALFVQRAQAVRHDFMLDASNAAAVAEVCRRLDGLPLAIELAAARSKILSPAALLARMAAGLDLLSGGSADQPARLQTMRAAISWSYDLLSEEEQTLFRRLAVFAGGSTLEQAEAVGGTPGTDILDGVETLVDASLLRREEGRDGEPRFGMLETIRQYGLERLIASGEEHQIRAHHAGLYLDLAERARPATASRLGQERWLECLEAEHGNLRGALAWLEQSGETESLLRLAGSLGWFWYTRGYLREGREILARALGICPADTDRVTPITRARALLEAGHLGWELGDYPTASAWLRESLSLSKAHGDRAGSADALLNLGLVAEKQGRDDEAAAHFEEALAFYREAANPAGLVRTLINLGDLAYRQGDHARSLELSEEGLALSRAHGDVQATARSLSNIAQLALERGDIARACMLYEEALAVYVSLRASLGIADALTGLAAIAGSSGQLARMVRVLGAVQAQCTALGVPIVPHHGQFARAVDAAKSGLDEPTFVAAWAEGSSMSLEAAIAEASTRTRSASRSPGVGLSSREAEVLQLIVAGQTDRQIAAALFISHRTVHGHVARLFAKLGVNSRTAATTVAVASGLARPQASPIPDRDETLPR